MAKRLRPLAGFIAFSDWLDCGFMACSIVEHSGSKGVLPHWPRNSKDFLLLPGDVVNIFSFFQDISDLSKVSKS